MCMVRNDPERKLPGALAVDLRQSVQEQDFLKAQGLLEVEMTPRDVRSTERLQVIHWLLAHNANPLLADDAGQTPLALAQKLQWTEVVDSMDKALSHAILTGIENSDGEMRPIGPHS